MKITQIIGVILLLLGAGSLIVGLFGLFGENLIDMNPWIFAILGLIFFFSGTGLLKKSST
jgi:hypothetical protein